MDRTQMLKVLVPVSGLAVLLILVAGVIALTDPANSAATTGGGTAPPPPPSKDDLAQAEPETGTFDKFPLDGPEWKDIGGGLKIWDVKVGSGKECPRGVTVSAQYSGWLLNGTSFDNPQKHGPAPVEFSLNGVIRGWTDGLPGMKVGGVRRLYIPSAMAYGAPGRPGIPPNSDLIFEVELASFR